MKIKFSSSVFIRAVVSILVCLVCARWDALSVAAELLGVCVCVALQVSIYMDIRSIEHRIEQMAEGAESDVKMQHKYRIDLDIASLLETMRRTIKQEYEGEALTRQAELEALQSQINPHFLYNTLDCIQGQALRSHNREIAEMTAAMSSYFRYSISMKDSIVTLGQEIRNIKNYILIQKYRFGDKIDLDIQYDSEETLEFLVPQMILQPLVENAVYHGLERISREGVVAILLSHTDEIMHVTVEDNGVGMSQELTQELNERLEHSGVPENSGEAHGGIALRNVNQRIRLLFGEEYGMHIFSVEGVGTKIVLYLPAVKEIAK